MEEATKDAERLDQFEMVRMTPYGVVSDADITEAAHLEMRVRVHARRVKELEAQSLSGGLSASEQSELDKLCYRPPERPKAPDAVDLAFEKYLKENPSPPGFLSENLKTPEIRALEEYLKQRRHSRWPIT